MTVSAVGQNQNSHLSTVVTSTAVGTLSGYAMKYAWPIQKQESDFNPRVMVNYCRKVTNKAKVAAFEAMGVKSQAQDCFVKMIKHGDKDAFKSSKLAEKVAALGGEGSASGKEFRGIIRNVNETSSQMIKRWAVAYNLMLKKIRPTVPFLVAGAGVGFLTGFTHNVLKTDA